LGIKKAKYRGIDRVAIQLYITAITSNIVKGVRLAIEQGKEEIVGLNKRVKNYLQNFINYFYPFLFPHYNF